MMSDDTGRENAAWRRLHGKVTVRLRWLHQDFWEVQITQQGALLEGYPQVRRFQAVEGAKAAGDAVVQQVVPHRCDPITCGSWTTEIEFL